eukprot:gnl/TRDRNA2_/TRDRNA2_198325_c0_seq1.p1 gnl/TRDRNA2_/TRDRNA2_198325_c0~~gnl/TRDRNA2_/TRDRNA2_198325_c0_seq1.p1  ORF type:complete len:495 (+),score=36.72 gnl/TRDRNA2_/TRDRNA2_198325_c0_seq1:142-1626(+)
MGESDTKEKDEHGNGAKEETGVEFSSVAESFGLRALHIRLIIVQWLAGIVGASINFSTPLSMGYITQDFGIRFETASWASVALAVGCFAGLMIFGWISDTMGRRTALLVEAAAIGLLTPLHLLLPAGSKSAFMLLVFMRFLIGIPYGGLSSLATLHLIEFCPSGIRGFLSCVGVLGWNFGNIYMICLARLLGPHWRIVFSFIPLPACTLLFLASYTTFESPRWLLVAGRHDEAKSIVDAVLQSRVLFNFGESKLLTQAPAQLVVSHQKSMEDKSLVERLRALWYPKIRRTTACASLVLLLCGSIMWGFNFWAPQMLKRLTNGRRVPYSAMALAELGDICGAISAAIWLDVVGRRLIMLLSFSCLALGLYGIAQVEGRTSTLWLNMWIINFAAAHLWAATTLYTMEVFPTQVRGTGVSFVWFCARTGQTVMPMVVGALLDGRGLLGLRPVSEALYLLAAFSVAGNIVVMAVPHETSGKAMEDVSARADDVSDKEK